MAVIYKGHGDNKERYCELALDGDVETVCPVNAVALYAPNGPDAPSEEEGEYVVLQTDADGALWVRQSGSIVTSGGGVGGIDTENVDNVTPQRPALGPGNEQTRFLGDPLGGLFVHPHPPHVWSSAAEYTTQQTDFELIAAPGAGYALYITDIHIHADGIGVISLEEEDTVDVLKFRVYSKVAGDGVAKTLRCPLKLSANKALTLTTSAAITVFVMASGYVSYVGA